MKFLGANPFANLLGRQSQGQHDVRRIQEDVEEELNFHLEMLAKDLEMEGHAPEEAARLAQIRFGDQGIILSACLRQNPTESTMLQKTQFVFTLLLILGLGFAMHGWSRASQTQAEEVQALRATIADFLDQERSSLAVDSLVPRSTIAVGDTLWLLDGEHPGEFSSKSVVALDGKLLVPNVGWLQVEGLTLAQLEKVLNDKLGPFFVTPPRVGAAFESRVANPQVAVDEIFIQTFDRLKTFDVSSDSNIDLTSTSEVQEDGSVYLPELGRISVIGKSRAELELFLNSNYAPYYENPVDVKVCVER